jgi:hypothetical protein
MIRVAEPIVRSHPDFVMDVVKLHVVKLLIHHFYLGIIPYTDKRGRVSKITAGLLVHNYHSVLDTILSGLVDFPENPPILQLRLGNEWNIVCVNFILKSILVTQFPAM